MYEGKGDKLLPFPRFIGRVGLCLLLALGIVAIGLFLGVLGYHFIAGLAWVDSILNASMILTGMGPIDPMKTTSAKLFASGYALFSGVVFLTSMSIVLAPVFHRAVHRFHLDDEEEDENRKKKPGN
jgi:flagellar biosynthesis protein FliR